MRPALLCFVLAAVGGLSNRSDAGEAEAVAFAKEHHPHLGELLQQLQSKSPREFAKAVRDVERSRLRLERVRKNRPDDYEDELAWWQVNSRIRVMSSRLTRLRMEANAAAPATPPTRSIAERTEQVEKALRDLLGERLKLEAVRLDKREQALLKQIRKSRARAARIESDRDKLIEAEFKRIESIAERAAGRKRPAAEKPPAKKPPAEKPKTLAKPPAAS